MRTVLARLSAVLFILPFFSPPAAAMTELEAASNVMHFAFAMKEGELCENLGYPGLAALKRWEEAHGAILVKSLARIEEYAAKSKKVTREQAKDVALGLFFRNKETFDREMAPKLGPKSCGRFGETLRYYESKLVKD